MQRGGVYRKLRRLSMAIVMRQAEIVISKRRLIGIGLAGMYLSSRIIRRADDVNNRVVGGIVSRRGVRMAHQKCQMSSAS